MQPIHASESSSRYRQDAVAEMPIPAPRFHLHKRRIMTAGTLPRQYVDRHSKRIWFGLAILLTLTAAALFAPYLAPRSSPLAPLFTSLCAANIAPGTSGHLFGTDYLGRDVLKEAIWGARTSLGVGILGLIGCGIRQLLGNTERICRWGDRLDHDANR